MPKPEQNTPILEWIAAALGAAALAAVLAVIGHGLVTRSGERPPAFIFETKAITRVGDRWHVGWRVTNTGDRPAASLKVIGELSNGSETAEVTLRYVPDRSTREAGFYFQNDPTNDTVRLRVVGYEVP